MNSEKTTCVKAFPRPNYGNNEDHDGMTLRDYFAAHAPSARDDWFDTLARRATYADYAMSEALWRYEYADAMLKERDL